MLEISKPVDLDLEKLPKDILEVAKIWSEKKLHRKYYRLKDVVMQSNTK